MSYIWKEGEPRANNVVDVDGFNSEYNAYKSMLNGGLDRENIPQNSIGGNEFKFNSSITRTDTPFYRAVTKDMVHPGEYKNYRNTTLGSHCFGGMTYANYSSGYVEIATQSLKCKEGMLQVELRGFLYINPVNATFFPKAAKIKITVDGVPIVETPGGYLTFINSLYLVGSTPVAEGNVSVGVHWSFSPMGSNSTSDDSSTDPQFYFDGISLALFNRFR